MMFFLAAASHYLPVLDGTLWYVVEVTALHNMPLIAEAMQSSFVILPLKLAMIGRFMQFKV